IRIMFTSWKKSLAAAQLFQQLVDGGRSRRRGLGAGLDIGRHLLDPPLEPADLLARAATAPRPRPACRRAAGAGAKNWTMREPTATPRVAMISRNLPASTHRHRRGLISHSSGRADPL